LSRRRHAAPAPASAGDEAPLTGGRNCGCEVVLPTDALDAILRFGSRVEGSAWMESYRIVAGAVEGLGAEGVAVGVERGRAVVACARSDAVTVVDLEGWGVVGEVSVGHEPMDIVFDSGSDRVFTADLLGESVSVVDASSLRAVGSVPVGSYPSG